MIFNPGEDYNPDGGNAGVDWFLGGISARYANLGEDIDELLYRYDGFHDGCLPSVVFHRQPCRVALG